jgi:hypothetical protein
MSLLGSAILAFSHDVTAGAEGDWTEWHDREHIPERLAIPGFLRLRRYLALDGAPRFFYFYETRDLEVLQSPAYLARLGDPTPWTRRCMQYVTNNRRTACRIAGTLGRGVGGVLGVTEIAPAPGRGDDLQAWLLGRALPDVVAMPGVVGAHLGEADAAATAVRSDEKALLRTPDAMARWLVLVEGVDVAAVAPSAAILSDAALLASGADRPAQRAMYQLGFVMGEKD